MLAGEFAQASVQVGVEPGAHGTAPVRGDHRAGPVGGQLDALRQTGQLPGPVVRLAREQTVRVGGVAEQVVLPEGVVGVLDRQLLPLGRLAAAARRVGSGQALREWPQRPAVARDVVEHQLEHVLVRCQLEQSDP
ncbi:hypothetical protein KAURM247S_05045 [Kitasatospora aureofaciens]